MPSDRKVDIPSLETRVIHKGMIWDVLAQDFEFAGEKLTREFVAHRGAVAVVAVNEKNEVLLIEQYRHPVKSYLLEIPAGLLDVEGESKAAAALRELEEETGFVAKDLEELVSFHTTPGGNSETITVFVARELTLGNGEFEAHGEERELRKFWLPISEVLDKILSFEIKSPSLVVGVMAYALKYGISPSSK